MKIALAQINSIVGDLSGNARKMLEYTREAKRQGAQLVLFPELALVGYPPRDTLSQPGFFAEHEKVLQQFITELESDIAVVFGALEQNSAKHGMPFLNTAYVVANGKIIFKQAKQLLPNYDIYDEPRHFAAGEAAGIFTWQGIRFGLSVCEDLWSSAAFLGKNLYGKNPLQQAALSGAEVFLNISASPFERDKLQRRLAQISTQVREFHLPIFYCTNVGALDELIFDGFSCATDANGKIQVCAKGFEEDLLVVDYPFSASAVEVKRNENELVWSALKLGLSDYVKKTGFQKVVLGLSGGIDSALVAVLAAEALGKENVAAVMLPSPYTSEESKTLAREQAEKLGIPYQEISIEAPFAAMKQSLQFAESRLTLTEENMQARIRGTLLMALANETKSLLLATSNKSELAMGYSTLYGDMCGALLPLGDLYKTQVYALSRWLNRESEIIPAQIILRAPTAELKPGQTDQDTLPPYEILDAILAGYLEKNQSLQELVAAGFAEKTVTWVLRQLHLMEYKRKQAAPILRVSSKAFGLGRRMPIAWNGKDLV